MADKSFFGEGSSLNKPPLFCDQNYPIWCIRMKFFIQSLVKNIWNVISNNTYVHMHEINESSKEHLDCMAQYIIVSTLDSDVLLKISECTTAKGMWNRLDELHKNPRSDLVDKEESSAGSISSKNKVEVCLMTKGESESSQVSTTSYNKCESYFQLLDAFQEIHEEAQRLTFSNNRLKCENKKLKMKITVLEKDLNQSKTDLENSELVYEKSSCKCDSNFCKNCESLQ